MHIVIYHRPYHHVSPCISLCITLHIIMYHRAYHHVTDQCDQREFHYFKKPNFFICLNAKKSTFCPTFFSRVVKVSSFACAKKVCQEICLPTIIQFYSMKHAKISNLTKLLKSNSSHGVMR